MLRFDAPTADKDGMTLRLSGLLPRAAALVLVGLVATAGLTYAAGQGIGGTTAPMTAAPERPGTVVVPDVRNQAFVFAKSALEDAGFSWKVGGSVHGFASNLVVSQSPLGGTKLLDTGAPVVTLTLKRNGGYGQVGTAEDVSPYTATPAERADLADRVVPATPPATTTTAAPAATTPTPAKPKPARKPATTAAPQARTPDFVVPGAAQEPADEIPLTERAAKLADWLKAHPKVSNTNVKYWLYQHEWVLTGAKLGWWHGADALRTLIAVDQRAEAQWGIGAKSEAAARAALRYVEAKAKS